MIRGVEGKEIDEESAQAKGCQAGEPRAECMVRRGKRWGKLAFESAGNAPYCHQSVNDSLYSEKNVDLGREGQRGR